MQKPVSLTEYSTRGLKPALPILVAKITERMKNVTPEDDVQQIVESVVKEERVLQKIEKATDLTPTMKKVATSLVERGVTSLRKIMTLPEMVKAIVEPLKPEAVMQIERAAEDRKWPAGVLVNAVEEITAGRSDVSDLLAGKREPCVVTEKNEVLMPSATEAFVRDQAKADNPMYPLVAIFKVFDKIKMTRPYDLFAKLDKDDLDNLAWQVRSVNSYFTALSEAFEK